MRQTDERVRDRIDAQIKILWSFKSRIEDCIAEAIEKQVARKPLDIPLEAWPHCPSCGGKLDDRENKNYCADCGQKLDWSDDE